MSIIRFVEKYMDRKYHLRESNTYAYFADDGFWIHSTGECRVPVEDIFEIARRLVERLKD